VIPFLFRRSVPACRVRAAGAERLLAAGGDLSPERLLAAYREGVFPWFGEEDPILWWSPDPRMVLYVARSTSRGR
jgi:leucyl/phenylalanyl-tRNA--protein transferase